MLAFILTKIDATFEWWMLFADRSDIDERICKVRVTGIALLTGTIPLLTVLV